MRPSCFIAYFLPGWRTTPPFLHSTRTFGLDSSQCRVISSPSIASWFLSSFWKNTGVPGEFEIVKYDMRCWDENVWCQVEATMRKTFTRIFNKAFAVMRETAFQYFFSYLILISFTLDFDTAGVVFYLAQSMWHHTVHLQCHRYMFLSPRAPGCGYKADGMRRSSSGHTWDRLGWPCCS